MNRHLLKIENQFFQDIAYGNKRFEVRRNDRDFKVGDELVLYSYDRESNSYNGAFVNATITYLMKGGSFGIELGYVVLSIVVVNIKDPYK